MQARKDVLLTMKNEEICSNPDEYNRLTILDTNAELFSEFKYVIIMLGMDGIKCENFYLCARSPTPRANLLLPLRRSGRNSTLNEQTAG